MRAGRATAIEETPASIGSLDALEPRARQPVRLAKPPSAIGNGGDTFLARVDSADRGFSGWLDARKGSSIHLGLLRLCRLPRQVSCLRQLPVSDARRYRSESALAVESA